MKEAPALQYVSNPFSLHTVFVLRSLDRDRVGQLNPSWHRHTCVLRWLSCDMLDQPRPLSPTINPRHLSGGGWENPEPLQGHSRAMAIAEPQLYFQTRLE